MSLSLIYDIMFELSFCGALLEQLKHRARANIIISSVRCTVEEQVKVKSMQLMSLSLCVGLREKSQGD